MSKISYVSSALSPSGYGSAARSDIASLFVSGISVSCNSIQQTAEVTDYGIEGQIAKFLEKRDIPYKIKLIHLTPDLIPVYQEKGIYTISRLAWETDQLPKSWIKPLNNVQDVWVTAPSIEKALRKSGVSTHCTVIPEAIYTQQAEEIIEPFLLKFPKDFVFFTIGQWIDRKNFRGLIRAYWKEFSQEENVSLLIKTYRMNYSDSEWKLVKREIEEWKREVPLKHYPKLLLVNNLLTEQQIQKLHKLGDCYVNPSSGEGWGRPVQEAMLYGIPVISGSHGGITDYLSKDSYFNVPSHKVKATENPSIPWYTNSMQWDMLDEKKLGEKMRYVFENYKEARETGKRGQKFVVDNFSYQKVGAIMKERLEEIAKTL